MNSEFQKYLDEAFKNINTKEIIEESEGVNNSKIIDELFEILTELDARDGCNTVIAEFWNKSWNDLCDDAIKLLEYLKA